MLSNLFFSLLKINVMATIVAVIVLALKYVLKKSGASRKLLFSLWIIIALRFVCPNFIESNFSLFNIFDNPISEEKQVTVNKNQTNITNTNNFIPTDINFNTDNTITDNTVVNTEINEIQTIIPSESVVKEQSNKLEITEILMLIWIAGSSCMILYALISYLKLKKTLMFAVKKDEGYYETDMISTPCVLGIIKPKIYLTLNLTEKEKKYILTHENIHIRRKDYFTKFVAYMILAIHWVNPISWILFKMFVNDMEMLCDEESIKKLGNENKVGYMESLISLSSRNMKNILPCPIAFSENNTEKRVKNMIKYKKSGIIISIVALVVCLIVAVICLTNKNKHEITNLAEDIYSYNNALLGDAPKMRSLVSIIPFYDKDIQISTIELDTETATTKEMGIIVNIDNLTSEEITGMNDVVKHSKIFLALVKNADFIQYNYISNEKKASLQIPRMYFNEDLSVYTESYEAFKNFIENRENTLDIRNEKVSLEEWNNIQEKIIYGELTYSEFNSNITYTDILTEESKLQELNDSLFTYTKSIKGGTACPFTATLILRTEKGKEIELQLATDSCTVFKIGEQYYEYTEDKGEDDPDEADFYKYFDKINAYINGEPIRSTFYNKILGYDAYYKDTVEPTFTTRNYYTKVNNVEYCIAESFGFEKEREDISLDIDGDGVEELICNCTYGGDGHQEVYIFKRNMSNNTGIPSIIIGKIDTKKVNLPELYDWGVNAILTGYDKDTNRFWINYSKGNEIKNEYSTVYLDLNDAMNIFAFEEFNSITSKTKGFENTSTVYINAIKNLYYNYKLPDGTEFEDPKNIDGYEISENSFAICDVDFDGKNELILAFTHHPMAAMRTIIYDYDVDTNKFREQFTEFTGINFYNNGVIEVLWSHNQGSAGDSLWPYTMYRYNNVTDKYEVIAQVDAWDKSFNEKCYIAETFPTEVDKDGNGIVYFVRNSGSDKDVPYDLKEYNEWRTLYVPDDNLKITVPYINLTEENINNIK